MVMMMVPSDDGGDDDDGCGDCNGGCVDAIG